MVLSNVFNSSLYISHQSPTSGMNRYFPVYTWFNDLIPNTVDLLQLKSNDPTKRYRRSHDTGSCHTSPVHSQKGKWVCFTQDIVMIISLNL